MTFTRIQTLSVILAALVVAAPSGRARAQGAAPTSATPAAAPAPAQPAPTVQTQAAPAPAVTLPPLPTTGFAEAHPGGDQDIPDWRVVLSNLAVFRWNPLGLEDQIKLGAQRKFYTSYDAMFKNNYIHFGIYPKINPAFIKLGPSLEIQPLSIFNVRFGVEYVDFFGSFGYMQSFQSPLDNYSDTTIGSLRGPYLSDGTGSGMENDRQPYSTSGVHATIEPTFQIKLGPLAIRDKFAAEYWNMNLRDGDRVFYDVTLDTLVPKHGWVIANDLDVLFVKELKTRIVGKREKSTLIVGARYSMVKPLYQDSDFRAPDEAAMYQNQNAHHRLGAILAFTFYDRPYTRFNKPTLLFICSWYMEHRYRAELPVLQPNPEQDTSQAIPYVILGFAFESDLLKK